MWSVHYLLLIFLAVLGVLQLAAVHNGFRGLLLFPSKIFSLVFAVLAIGFALFSFFTWYNFYNFVVEGSQQTGSFVVSSAAAIVFNLAASSLLNLRRFNGGNHRDGLDALRESTFFQAIWNHRTKEER
jgi:hypothetical protein